MPRNSKATRTWDDTPTIEQLLTELTAIRTEMIQVALPPHSQIHPNYRKSALNLLHYLVLRRHDLRPLQLQLTSLGLSSLGRAESYVLATVDAVLEVLHRLLPNQKDDQVLEAARISFADGQRLLAKHTDALLGPAPAGRGVRIMVTMPREAAEDQRFVVPLLQRGMNAMRINCAHDDAPAWLKMIKNLRAAEQALGLPCRVVLDLAGPKLRTGPLEPAPAVIRIRPSRDSYGRVTAPARVWLTSEALPQPPPAQADACLPLPTTWLARLCPGDDITFIDTREAHRHLTVVDSIERGIWAELTKTAYIAEGTSLKHKARVGKRAKSEASEATVGVLPPGDNALLLHNGDPLVVTRDGTLGRPATYDSAGGLLTPPMIDCTLPEVFDDVHAGESIWFDDGKIGGMVEKVEPSQVQVRITQAGAKGTKLRADKGINFPDSTITIAAMTEKDQEDLEFIVQHADIVELSFANTAQDVEQLQAQLTRLGGRHPAVVLKIETRQAFENLPEMLLAAMQLPCFGVMIARGDLAIECGFERLAEVQEEILWLCEAAHAPVVWATQVLESLAQEGMPSRAEITDAAMGDRAECVMLNKGPYIHSAIEVLDDILRRMQAHQNKKKAMLRELQLAHIPAPGS